MRSVLLASSALFMWRSKALDTLNWTWLTDVIWNRLCIIWIPASRTLLKAWRIIRKHIITYIAKCAWCWIITTLDTRYITGLTTMICMFFIIWYWAHCVTFILRNHYKRLISSWYLAWCTLFNTPFKTVKTVGITSKAKTSSGRSSCLVKLIWTNN